MKPQDAECFNSLNAHGTSQFGNLSEQKPLQTPVRSMRNSRPDIHYGVIWNAVVMCGQGRDGLGRGRPLHMSTAGGKRGKGLSFRRKAQVATSRRALKGKVRRT